MTKFILYIAMITIFAAPSTRAQDASELLEDGLYTEEAIGDLSAAIAIYNRIIADSTSAHVAADARLRLGLCHFKLGHKKQARSIWHELINNHPEQTHLIALARRYMPDLHPTGLVLKNPPWNDGEILQYVLVSLRGKFEVEP